MSNRASCTRYTLTYDVQSTICKRHGGAPSSLKPSILESPRKRKSLYDILKTRNNSTPRGPPSRPTTLTTLNETAPNMPPAYTAQALSSQQNAQRPRPLLRLLLPPLLKRPPTRRQTARSARRHIIHNHAAHHRYRAGQRKGHRRGAGHAGHCARARERGESGRGASASSPCSTR